MINGLFGIFVVGCGIYCLYGYYMLKFKHEVNRTIVLSKDVNIKKCKDYAAYCKELEIPLLLLGIAVTLYGGVDLYNTYVGGADTLFMIVFAVFLIVLIYYLVTIRKCNRKYF